jgi:hypothetical protein
VWLEGLGQLKNPITSSGIKPMTFQLVAYCLNKLCYHAGHIEIYIFNKCVKTNHETKTIF